MTLWYNEPFVLRAACVRGGDGGSGGGHLTKATQAGKVVEPALYSTVTLAHGLTVSVFCLGGVSTRQFQGG